MSEKLTKQDLKGHDKFVTSVGKAAAWALDHRAKFIGTAVSLVVLGAVWAAYGYVRDQKEETAFTDLYKAQNIIHEVDLKLKVPADSPAATAGSLESDYKEAVTNLKAVISKYSGTQASVFAALDLARLYGGHKAFAEEAAVLEEASRSAKHAVTRGLVMSRLGVAYANLDQCTKAVPQFEAVEKDKDLSFLQGFVLIQKGLCHEKLSQLDKAQEAYKKAEGLAQDQEASKLAKRYLRALKVGGKAS